MLQLKSMCSTPLSTFHLSYCLAVIAAYGGSSNHAEHLQKSRMSECLFTSSLYTYLPLLPLLLHSVSMCCRQYVAWRVGWMERKRLNSCGKPALLLWGFLSLLLPAAAFSWALNGTKQQPQQYRSWNGFKFYAGARLILQLGGEAALFLLSPCSINSSRSSSSSGCSSSGSSKTATARMRSFVSYIFHLRYAPH